MSGRSSPPDYFEKKYALDPDPWDYASSDYERGKYAATLDALPRPRFRRGLEIGCSIGVMTGHLAARCDSLVAVDVSSVALDRARQSCRDQTNVTFALMRIPSQWPAQTFDLVVLSEVLYYLSRRDVARTARNVLKTLEADGAVILVHWLGDTGVGRTGDDAASWFAGDVAPNLRVTLRRRTADYRLDVLSR
jgi:cyclopropane fatty-acyl-phospholipid synthase-like methyltransferase